MDRLYEFEREPVSENKLQPGKHFAGIFAGEHVAGTEFVIGALFVTWGASAFDMFVGLLLGNLMAVLTWTFICAPIAVRTRLTLYWYLRKIAGPVTTTIYNVLNAVLFCILAGCMITVSASAVRTVIGTERYPTSGIPPQVDWLPNDIRFVLIVAVVGAVVVTLAILGFKKLAQFAEVCAPWMFLMFIAGAVIMLPRLAAELFSSGRISSFQDFWELANQSVWTGIAPEGNPQISFWHVAAFAWICNLAMHGGMSDMALFRYAKKSSYGLYSAFGMLLGHYLAWICAGIMGAGAALALGMSLTQLDAGGVAWEALGMAGILAVVIAGWTTSNPTLYRAGLAFQAVTPGWPRWLVTLVAGGLTTAIACSPFVFTKLLDFVGLYGLLLMPVGAIVFIEHWIFPKIGFTQFWVSKKKLLMSWPALLSWVIAIGVALVIAKDSPLVSLLEWMNLESVANALSKLALLHLFFLFVPVWVLTSVLYIIFASMAGAREKFDDQPAEPIQSSEPITETEQPKQKTNDKDPVLWTCAIVAMASLAACVILPLWVYFSDKEAYLQNHATFKNALIWPTVIYFITATIWNMKRSKAK
jgi:NCS1 family nucleobase:cation symporter-1